MSFVPDSKVVIRVEPSIGFRKGLYLPRDTGDIAAAVVHTTGLGPVKRVVDASYRKWRGKNGIDAATAGGKDRAAFKAALWIYGKAYKPGPHYVIGQELGLVAQVCPEDRAAWHVGAKGARLYATRPDAWWRSGKYGWWKNAFPDLESPRDLAGGKLWAPYTAPAGFDPRRWRAKLLASYARGSVNASTIGLEVVPRVDDPRGPWSDDAWRNLSELLLDITGRHEIPRDREHVISHSIAHPASRTTPSGFPWDTNSMQFTYELLEARESRFTRTP